MVWATVMVVVMMVTAQEGTSTQTPDAGLRGRLSAPGVEAVTRLPRHGAARATGTMMAMAAPAAKRRAMAERQGYTLITPVENDDKVGAGDAHRKIPFSEVLRRRRMRSLAYARRAMSEDDDVDLDDDYDNDGDDDAEAPPDQIRDWAYREAQVHVPRPWGSEDTRGGVVLPTGSASHGALAMPHSGALMDTVESAGHRAEHLVVSVLLDGSLVASDARTGEEVWRFDTGEDLVGASAAGDQPMVVPGADGSLYSMVDTGAGEDGGKELVMKRYPLNVKELVMETPSLTNEGTTVVGLRRAYTFALSRRHGTLIASFPSSSAPQESLLQEVRRKSVSAYDIDDIIFFGRTDYTIRSYDLLTAMEAWNVTYAEVRQITNKGLQSWGDAATNGEAGEMPYAKVSLTGEVHVYHQGVERVVTDSLQAPAVSVYLLGASGGSLQIMNPDGSTQPSRAAQQRFSHEKEGFADVDVGESDQGGGDGTFMDLGIVLGSNSADGKYQTYALSMANVIIKNSIDGSVCEMELAMGGVGSLQGRSRGCAAHLGSLVIPRSWSPMHTDLGESVLPVVRPAGLFEEGPSHTPAWRRPTPALPSAEPNQLVPVAPPPAAPTYAVSLLSAVLAVALALLLAVTYQYHRSSREREIADEERLAAVMEAREAREQAKMSAAETAQMKEEASSKSLLGRGGGGAKSLDPDTGIVSIGHLKYNSYDILGTGSVGTIVYSGEMDGRPVAVKRMLGQFYDIARKELGVLVKADDHPNVVRCCGWEEDSDFVYVALEQCQCSVADMVEGPRVVSFRSDEGEAPEPVAGGRRRRGGGGQHGPGKGARPQSSTTPGSNEIRQARLDERMKQTREFAARYRFRHKKSGQLTDDGVRLVQEILSGLTALHDRKIIHRDLKPQNVLISFDGHAKISDMGLSKKLEGEQSSYHTQVSGTVGWQAPEQIRGDRQTRAVDAFAMGCLIYYILTGGKHPFGEPLERSTNIMRRRPPQLNVLRNSPAAQHLVAGMVRLDCASRWSAKAALHHPLWWGADKTLRFVKEVSNRLEPEDRADDLSLLTSFERSGFAVFKGHPWDRMTPKAFIADLNLRRRYNFHSFRDFCRAIRNKSEHFDEVSADARAAVGDTPGDMLQFFSSRFPLLIVTLFDFARKNFARDKMIGAFIDGSCASAPDVGDLSFPGDEGYVYSGEGAVLSVEKWIPLAMANVEQLRKAEGGSAQGGTGGGGKKRPSLKGSTKLPQRPDMPICEFYKKTGWCRFGSKCMYHHPPLPTAED